MGRQHSGQAAQWAAARRGLLKPFPGITEPYEVPADAELRLDTVRLSPTQAAAKIIQHLRAAGFLQQRQESRGGEA